MSPSSKGPERVVICPDLLLESILIEEASPVLRWWRDGKIRLAVSPPLLVLYLRGLRRLGLTDEQIHRWAWWFSSSEHCELVNPPAI